MPRLPRLRFKTAAASQEHGGHSAQKAEKTVEWISFSLSSILFGIPRA